MNANTHDFDKNYNIVFDCCRLIAKNDRELVDIKPKYIYACSFSTIGIISR